ncbi:MAG: UDP-N-acetylmuramate--L-alanine ligase [Bellilinea sp.]|nr:MAG: UDP-N-acetylmuramate--L-alanine ligase [Bellilinea sp.]
MKHVHLIGIGGSGLSAIALFLKEKGYHVTGSDRALSPLAAQLVSDGITVYAGHDPANVRGADVVIRSSAVPLENPEVQAALEAGIPVLKRQEFLEQLCGDQTVLAIAGTHGKTTTTAMLAWVLTRLNHDPSYLIGGVSKNLRGNAHAGRGKWFVIEADEYDHMFLGLKPGMILLTTVEHDHPDCFPTPESYFEAFAQFIKQLQPGGVLIANAENSMAARLAEEVRQGGGHCLTYALQQPADVQATIRGVNEMGGLDFEVSIPSRGQPLRSIRARLQVPGSHNVMNAAAVLSACSMLGLSLDEAAQALTEFSGTGRRFDVLGEANGVVVVDDYAHHPTEVNATLSAAKMRYPRRRIWAVWQPHTYSRTLALMEGFTRAFQSADEVVVTEVYAARERNEGFSAAQVVSRMAHPSVRFIPTIPEATAFLLKNLQKGDVLLVLSAGDADQISAQVFSALKEKELADV